MKRRLLARRISDFEGGAPIEMAMPRPRDIGTKPIPSWLAGKTLKKKKNKEKEKQR